MEKNIIVKRQIVFLGICVFIFVVTPFICAEEIHGLQLSGKITKQGTPEVYMWAPEMPTSELGAGYPISENTQHIKIFHATAQNGGYNHHTRLSYINGKFYAIWSNNSKAEDAPGQRVLYSTSKDGLSWANWQVAFPTPGEIKEYGEPGLFLSSSGWQVHNCKIYALAGVHKVMGWETADGASFSIKRDSVHSYIKYKYIGKIVRELKKNGEFGPIFALNEGVDDVEEFIYKVTSCQNQQFATTAKALQQQIYLGDTVVKSPPVPIDTARLCEPTIHETIDGKKISLWRDDMYSHRMYVSVLEDNGTRWSKAMPTNIPDTPSARKIIRLDNGKLLLIGNQAATQFDNPENPKHYLRDPLTLAISEDGYVFSKVYAVRCGKQKFRVLNVGGIGSGAQYPDVVVVDGNLYLLYSMGKEDIWISIVPLSEICN